VGQWQAVVHLAEPDRGLTDWHAGPDSVLDAGVLGLEMPGLGPGLLQLPPDCYCRGAALIVGYPEWGDRPVRVDASWRALPPAADGSEAAAAVELVVSMRTELLESQPRLAVHSRLPAGEVFRLADAARGQFERLGLAKGQTVLAAAGESGPAGCWLFRFPGHQVSYAEMVHPADFQGSELGFAAEKPPAVEVRHRLFVEHLEKGVILRARVRGALLPRQEDAALAAAVYAAFASADPPLGS
jgi:hypothetical protein